MFINRWRLLHLIAFSCVIAADANATISVARAKNWTSRVTVEGKDANATFGVWKRLLGAEAYTYIGYSITTDGNGNGTVSLPNSTGATLYPDSSTDPPTGYEVKIGDDDAQGTPGNQAAKSVAFEGGSPYWVPNWWASLTPGTSGPHAVRLRQAVVADGTTLLETWDTGMVISFRLEPTQAKWINMGAAIVPHGDLSASIASVTDERVTVHVNGDPAHSTIDDLEISGLGINVLTTGSVSVYLEWSGTSSDYLDGVFLESFSWPQTQSYEFARFVPPVSPIPTVSEWGLTVMTLMILIVATILFARLRPVMTTT